jgi:hypothetical protein
MQRKAARKSAMERGRELLARACRNAAGAAVKPVGAEAPLHSLTAPESDDT